MKRILLISIFFAASIFCQTSNKGNIQIEIINLESSDGFVMIALFNSEESYNEEEKSYKNAKLKITEGKVQYMFEDLPFGEYAIKLFHDENGNGKLDKGMFGIPTEDYAFSNNAKGSMGPADYSDAKFLLNKKLVVQKLDID